MKQVGFCQLHVQYSVSILHATELLGLHRTLLYLFTEIQKSVQNSYAPSWLHVHSIYAELSGINMLANDDIIVTSKFYPSNKRVVKHKGVLVTLYRWFTVSKRPVASQIYHVVLHYMQTYACLT